MADIVDENSNNIIDENSNILIDGTKEFAFALTSASDLVQDNLFRIRDYEFDVSASSASDLVRVIRVRDLVFSSSPQSTISSGLNLTIAFRFAVAGFILADESGNIVVDEIGNSIVVGDWGSYIALSKVSRVMPLSFGLDSSSVGELAGSLLRIRDYGVSVSSGSDMRIDPRLRLKLNIPFVPEGNSTISQRDLLVYSPISGNVSATYADVSGGSVTYDDVLRR